MGSDIIGQVVNSFMTRKYFRFGIGILLAVFIVYFVTDLIVYEIRLAKGKPAKFFIWEKNYPKLDSFSVYITKTIVVHDTFPCPQSNLRTTQRASSSPNIKQESKYGNNEANIVSGTVSGSNVGGHDNTINNFGLQPRVLNPADFKPLAEQIPKNKLIHICFLGSPDGEMIDVQRQLVKILKAYRFANLEIGTGYIAGSTLVDSKLVLGTAADSGLLIGIPPNIPPAH